MYKRQDQVSDASVGYDENGFPQVNISLDSEGGAKCTDPQEIMLELKWQFFSLKENLEQN